MSTKSITKSIIRNKIEKLLAKEFYLTVEALGGKGTVYSVNTDAEKPYIKILAYRNCVAVCSCERLHAKVRALLQDRSRDEIFEMPFVYGQTIHYVPDFERTVPVPAPPGCEWEFLMGEKIRSLNGLKGFENALAFDENGSTPTRAVCIARCGGRIIGAAGAADSSVDGVWEAGVDVMEAYRGAGLGTCLVDRLTRELLTREIVPFYSASVTNLGSQMVAAGCGYRPMWVDTFGTVLDGSSVYEEFVRELK